VLDAGRFQTMVDTTNAKRAFPNSFSFFINVNGTIRTTIYAEATASAFLLIYSDNAVLSFNYGINGTEIGTSWVLALEAQTWDKVQVHFVPDFPRSYAGNYTPSRW
jgi:hypothetical protein